MNKKKYTVYCENCKGKIELTPTLLQEKVITMGGEELIATYIECPVCGQISLKQLDTYKSKMLALKLTKKKLRQQHSNKAAAPKDKKRLQQLDKQLSNIRGVLNTKYWAKVHQHLN